MFGFEPKFPALQAGGLAMINNFCSSYNLYPTSAYNTDFVARESGPPNIDVIAFQHLVWASPMPSRDLEPDTGLEPATSGLRYQCSTN